MLVSYQRKGTDTEILLFHIQREKREGTTPVHKPTKYDTLFLALSLNSLLQPRLLQLWESDSCRCFGMGGTIFVTYSEERGFPIEWQIHRLQDGTHRVIVKYTHS